MDNRYKIWENQSKVWAVYCDACGSRMREEHQHFRCPICGFIAPCCEGIMRDAVQK